MRGALSTLARSRPAGGMVVSVLGDTFADVVCRPLESLPDWGKVSESSRRIVPRLSWLSTSILEQYKIVNSSSSNRRLHECCTDVLCGCFAVHPIDR